ncbi:MAG: aminopeptidase P family protein [Planctomycetes bacterium]|nr:aminopeptidase P family protein [Planctomycetota bacterium]
MSSQTAATADPLAAELVAACASRVTRLRSVLETAGVDALLVGHHTDIRYLTGFAGDDSLLLVTGEDTAPVIITDARHDQLLEPWRHSGADDVAEVVIATRHQLGKAARQWCADRGVSRLGIQAEHVTLADRRAMDAEMQEIGIVETDGLVGTLRLHKDLMEVAAIERAIAIHQEAMQAAIDRLTPGMREMEFAAAIEYEMKIRGASGPSFDTCVSAGANSAVIHYQSARTRIEPGTLLVDWGAVVDGYCSDMTRTWGVGRLPGKIGELYGIVLDAQLAAIDACAPGRSCAEVDGVARKIITDAGYGEQFGHGLGHGLGLDVHEGPYFNPQATKTVLATGMVMTVEPGIYLPGIGGVRIEDDVLITDDGCRVLGSFPKDAADAVLAPMGERP